MATLTATLDFMRRVQRKETAPILWFSGAEIRLLKRHVAAVAKKAGVLPYPVDDAFCRVTDEKRNVVGYETDASDVVWLLDWLDDKPQGSK